MDNRKETLRQINTRVVQGTITKLKIKDSEIEGDITAQIDHGRDSYAEVGLGGGLRTSSIEEEERRFRGSVESNQILEVSIAKEMYDSMDSDMYVQRNVGSVNDDAYN